MSISPALGVEAPRVHRLTIDRVNASVRASPAVPALTSHWRSCCEIETGPPKLTVSEVEIARKPAVLEQAIALRTHVVYLDNWMAASGSSVGQAGAESASCPESDNEPRQSHDSRTVNWVPVIHDARDTVARLPYRRKGLTSRQIGQAEIESHLNAARTAKGVHRENARIVAVFRRTPVELISRMRFDQSRRLLLFRLISCEGLRRTRVYDMVAVKDLPSGKLHLIPNRTRYREVSLS